MPRRTRSGIATPGRQRPVPSLSRTMEAMRVLGRRTGTRAEALDREPGFTISPDASKR
jgi:hypothetical protein